MWKTRSLEHNNCVRVATIKQDWTAHEILISRAGRWYDLNVWTLSSCSQSTWTEKIAGMVRCKTQSRMDSYFMLLSNFLEFSEHRCFRKRVSASLHRDWKSRCGPAIQLQRLCEKATRFCVVLLLQGDLAVGLRGVRRSAWMTFT